MRFNVPLWSSNWISFESLFFGSLFFESLFFEVLTKHFEMKRVEIFYQKKGEL